MKAITHDELDTLVMHCVRMKEMYEYEFNDDKYREECRKEFLRVKSYLMADTKYEISRQ